MELATLASGKKTNNTEKVLKPGPMVQVTKECTLKDENMEEGVSHGLITALTLVTSWRTILKGKVSYPVSMLTFCRYL